MSTTRINSLNLCSKAIESFRQSSEKGLNFTKQDRRFLNWVVETLEESQKFLLPDNGRLMEDIDVIKNADMMRLPYPVTALEYRINDNARRALPGETSSPSRIALCFSATSAALDCFRKVIKLPDLKDEDGFYVTSIFSMLDGSWFIVPTLQFIETNPNIVDAQGEMIDYYKAGGEKVKHKKATINPSYILPFDAGLSGYVDVANREGPDAMMRSLIIDALDEMNAARAFAVTMNCSNIKEELIVAPKGINKKRARKGRTLLQDFRVLTIDVFKSGTESSSEKGKSERTLPRQHLRRGHIRRLQDRIIWINSSVVGSGDIVKKNYRIKPKG